MRIAIFGTGLKRGIALIMLLALLGGLIYWIIPRPEEQPQARLLALPEPAGTFARAQPGFSFAFPRDFAPKPNFQTEWWYYTGNLQSPDGRQFGYQLTFFRRALHGPDQRQSRPSAWAVEQIYMAHFTLADVGAQQFSYFERFERGSAGLAGASIDPAFRVWLGNWSVEQTEEGVYRLRASQDGIALDLLLTDVKGPILQGDSGYSQKGPQAGNASYYFSQTRLETSGQVKTPGQEYSVNGLSWMDREISTSALGPDEIGWDWFSFHLSDGSDLMLYNLRRKDGGLSPYSSGTLIRPDGSTRQLKRDDFEITVTATWNSPHSKAKYPSAWSIVIPSEELILRIQPRLADQELQVSVIYWEGTVSGSGERQGQAVNASGYVELTGYGTSLGGQL